MEADGAFGALRGFKAFLEALQEGQGTLGETWNSRGLVADSCSSSSCWDPRHCTWPQAWGSLTNGHESLTFLNRLEASERWKGARVCSPTMASCQRGHIPSCHPSSCCGIHRVLGGEGEDSSALERRKDYSFILFSEQFCFFHFEMQVNCSSK